MDSDCLVKLTKAGAKDAVTKALEVYIPRGVVRETVVTGKQRRYADAIEIESNIRKKRLRVLQAEKSGRYPLISSRGEAQVLTSFLKGGYDAVASDDQRFLKKLDSEGIPYLTPTACILYLFYNKANTREEVIQFLFQVRPFVSNEEYEIARHDLEVLQ